MDNHKHEHEHEHEHHDHSHEESETRVHVHVHDENCGHDHHNHDESETRVHIHVHDENCGCEIDEPGHVHDENCGHSHGDIYAAPEETPSVFSHTLPYTFKSEVPGSKLEAALLSTIEKLKGWTKENKYMVGHIKLFVDGGNNANLWLSTTGKTVNKQSSSEWESSGLKGCTLHFTAIIFGVDLKSLTRVVEEYLKTDLQDFTA